MSTDKGERRITESTAISTATARALDAMGKRLDTMQADVIRSAVFIAALEARCHELEGSRAAGVQSQIADLQERVGSLENEHSRVDLLQGWTIKHNKMMVDDRRDAERPVKPAQMKCLLPCDDFMRCEHRSRHSWQSTCAIPCSHHKTCQPVPAQEPVQPAPELVNCDYQHCFAVCCYTAEGDHRRPHERRPDCERQHCDHGKARCIPVPAQEPVQPAPELVRCEDYQQCKLGCHALASGGHRTPHARRPDCDQMSELCRSRCIPVPASPGPAIPDVPTPVGTEAFRRELRRHADELSQGYGYQGRMDAALMGIDEPWEHLAGVACTLRDAYELARCGENEAAEEKLREIEW